MLVLTRKIGQSIILDHGDSLHSDPIVVKVLKVERDRVSIGIQAPRDVGILREELVSRKEESLCRKCGRAVVNYVCVDCYHMPLLCTCNSAGGRRRRE